MTHSDYGDEWSMMASNAKVNGRVSLANGCYDKWLSCINIYASLSGLVVLCCTAVRFAMWCKLNGDDTDLGLSGWPSLGPGWQFMGMHMRVVCGSTGAQRRRAIPRRSFARARGGACPNPWSSRSPLIPSEVHARACPHAYRSGTCRKQA